MTIKYGNRVQETSTTTGAGPMSLAGADTNYVALSAVFANGDEVPYGIVGDTGWEVGIGTFVTGTPNTLQRTTVLASSNAGSAVSWPAGTKKIYCTVPMELIPFRPRSSDPASPRPGETWFNTSTGAFKGAATGTATWTAGTAVGTSGGGLRGVGPSGSAMIWSSARFTTNGTTWSTAGFPPIVATSNFCAFGVASSAVSTCGSGGNAAYKFTGSGWTSIASPSTLTCNNTSGCGDSSLSGIKVGGNNGTTMLTNVENYNGTSWSAGTALGSGTQMMSICGTPTAVKKAGGSTVSTPTAINTVEHYNGTAWSASTVMSANRLNFGLVGTQSEALAFGGSAASNADAVATTEFWNGTAWSSSTAIPTTLRDHAFAGTSARDCWACCGVNNAGTAQSQAYLFAYPSAAIKTFTVA
jgi:hypothetical protein